MVSSRPTWATYLALLPKQWKGAESRGRGHTCARLWVQCLVLQAKKTKDTHAIERGKKEHLSNKINFLSTSEADYGDMQRWLQSSLTQYSFHVLLGWASLGDSTGWKFPFFLETQREYYLFFFLLTDVLLIPPSKQTKKPYNASLTAVVSNIS